MKLSKYYKPNSIYQDKAGTRYTIKYNEKTRLYHMWRTDNNNETIPNSGCTFSKWTNELKLLYTLFEIDMWNGDVFEPMKYHADASFYPGGSFGFNYRGSIYDDTGKIVGDYGANDSVWIENNFKIEWR